MLLPPTRIEGPTVPPTTSWALPGLPRPLLRPLPPRRPLPRRRPVPRRPKTIVMYHISPFPFVQG